MTALSRPASAKTRPAEEKEHKPASAKPKGPGKPAKKTGATAARRKDVARQLAQEIEALRATCRDVVQAYELRVSGQLAAVVDAISGDTHPAEKSKTADARTLTAALATVRALKLKPKKGRVKDLARLERLAEALSERLAGQQ